MKITHRSRWQLRLQDAGFYSLFAAVIGLVGWLSLQYYYQADWTAGNRNTLSDVSQKLLHQLPQSVQITAFVQDDKALRRSINERLKRFQRYKSDISLQFVNPDLEPQKATQAGISSAGQLLISMGDRHEKVDDLSEATIVNALQRLARKEVRWAVFTQGHGERDPFSDKNQGLSQLVNSIKRSGLNIQNLNLIRTPTIPANTSVLVIASPQEKLLAGEVERIRKHVANGGNLLWLRDPGEEHGLEMLAEQLGIHFLQGVIVDANQQLRSLLGIQHPAVIPVVDYQKHALTRSLKTLTLFPYAGGILHQKVGTWESKPFLVTLARTWSETGSMTGKEATFHQADGDTKGPLTIGISLTREWRDREQRIVIIGDSDFMANGYLGNGGNLELATNIFNWLNQDDNLISIIPRSAPDTQLNLDNTSAGIMAGSFLVGLPLASLVIGYTIWFRRRRR